MLKPSAFLLLLVSCTLPVAQANDDSSADTDKPAFQDSYKCKQYSDLKQRSRCMKVLKQTNHRVQVSKCKKDIKCWSKQNRDRADKYCKTAFDRRAAHSSYWQKYWSGQSLEKARWLNRDNGSMIYYKVESSVVLECLFFPNAPTRTKARLAAKAV